MKKQVFLWCLGLMLSVANAQMPQAPEVAARAYLLMDVTANQVLAQRDADMAVEPASLTKLMTAYLVFDALRSKKISLQQTFSVSPKAWKMPGSWQARIRQLRSTLLHSVGIALFVFTVRNIRKISNYNRVCALNSHLSRVFRAWINGLRYRQ